MKNTILLLVFPFFMFGQTQIGDDIDGESANDRLGSSVSIANNGNTVAVGASGGANGNGQVKVFHLVEGNWIQIGNSINGEAIGDTSDVVSLSNNGTILAVGAPFSNANGNDSGQVRIFENIGENWIQLGNSIIGESIGDISGVVLSLSGDGSKIAIGAPLNSGNGVQSGHVRVFENVGGFWTQIGDDIDGEFENDISGSAVSLSNIGNVVVVGAQFNDGNGNDSGHVRVFENVAGNWVQIGNDIDGENEGDRFGYSVSISNDNSIIAAGALANNGNGNFSGHVRVFKNIGGSWIQLGNDIDGEFMSDLSGASISLSNNGNKIAIGAYQNDGNGNDSGHVRIFEFIEDFWVQIGDDIDGEGPNDNSGIELALSNDGNTVVIGAPINGDNGLKSGHVRVYDLSQILSLNEQLINTNFTIYPNPASKNITIDVAENIEITKINIYNTLGQLVQTEAKTNFDISALAAGNYYVQVTTSEGVSSEKLLVE